MEINAYDQSYIEDAALNLGELFDYFINYLGISCDETFHIFATSKVGRSFEKGNPAYIAGHSGIELAYLLFYNIKLSLPDTEYDWPDEKSPEYWAGWAIAWYQWKRNIRFEDMINKGLNATKIISMYILHEADITKFIEACDSIIEVYERDNISMLKRLREYHRLTQKALSEKSGVSLRMIQLYEQGQNSMAKAQVSVVYSLAKALDCRIEDLL